VKLETESGVPTWSGSGESSPHAQMATFSLCFHMSRGGKSPAFPSSSYKVTNPFIEAPLS